MGTTIFPMTCVVPCTETQSYKTLTPSLSLSTHEGRSTPDIGDGHPTLNRESLHPLLGWWPSSTTGKQWEFRPQHISKLIVHPWKLAWQWPKTTFLKMYLLSKTASLQSTPKPPCFFPANWPPPTCGWRRFKGSDKVGCARMQETNLWFCQVDSFLFHVPYQPVTNLQHFRILAIFFCWFFCWGQVKWG